MVTVYLLLVAGGNLNVDGDETVADPSFDPMSADILAMFRST